MNAILRRVGLAAAISAALILAVSTPASAVSIVLHTENFANSLSTAGAWIYGGSRTPCLTAGTGTTVGSIPGCGFGDTAGSGVLHLTDGNSQSSYVILNNPVATSVGLQVSFDMFQYGGGSDPGDGMAFMLIDGSVTPSSAGASGAAIGYGSYGVTPGIAGGYVGVAFDTYGAFSNPGVGDGGTPLGPNSISVRGSEATNYNFITGVPASGALANGGTFNRELARRHVVVTISSQNIMSVAVDYGSGLVTELDGIDLATINGVGSLPATLKVGISAGTGGSYDIQEVQNFELTTLAPDLGVTVSDGSLDPSTLRGSVGITVAADAAGGSTTGPVTVTSTLPSRSTPLSAIGTGWTCSIVGQLVTCTRTGTGADRLDAGESYPPITLGLAVTSTAVLPLTIGASVVATDDTTTANNSDSGALTVGVAGAVAPVALAATNGTADPVVAPVALAVIVLGVVATIASRRHWAVTARR